MDKGTTKGYIRGPLKVKRLISFSPSGLKWLKAHAGKLDVSVSEIVRRLVDAERERVTPVRR